MQTKFKNDSLTKSIAKLQAMTKRAKELTAGNNKQINEGESIVSFDNTKNSLILYSVKKEEAIKMANELEFRLESLRLENLKLANKIMRLEETQVDMREMSLIELGELTGLVERAKRLVNEKD